MKTSDCILKIGLLLLLFSLGACGGTQKSVDSDMGSINVYNAEETAEREAKAAENSAVASIAVETQNLSLADMLRRVAGVQVSGSGESASVMVRGGGSMSGSNSPLFVIDNNPIGNSYTQVAGLIEPNDIDKISVLKDASATSRYGMRGSAGVIIIKTKAAAAARAARKAAKKKKKKG